MVALPWRKGFTAAEEEEAAQSEDLEKPQVSVEPLGFFFPLALSGACVDRRRGGKGRVLAITGARASQGGLGGWGGGLSIQDKQRWSYSLVDVQITN